mmetsp:Transcript_131450/g.331993  ORF Transcript_131450/g.331993 Transcript_131450/m.331993 type:complete len:299 (+) Transcript_131450:780-1676(+)
MRRRERGQEVLLHLLHRLAVVQKLVDEHDLLLLLGRRVAELGNGQIRGDVHAGALDTAIFVGGRLHEVHGVGPLERPAEVGEEHEGALQDTHQDDPLALAPRLDLARHDPDACLELLLGEDEAVILLVLKILRPSEWGLHVAVPLRRKELPGAGRGGFEDALLLQVLLSLPGEQLPEDALHQRGNGQTAQILGVQPLDVLDARHADGGCCQGREPLREEGLLVGKGHLEQILQAARLFRPRGVRPKPLLGGHLEDVLHAAAPRQQRFRGRRARLQAGRRVHGLRIRRGGYCAARLVLG